MTYYKCAEEGCPAKPISFANHCWQHIPDKKSYLKKLRKNIESSVAPVNLDKIVLENFDLSGLDLRSASFAGAIFINVNFSDTNLTNVNFKRAFFQNCQFEKTKLVQGTLVSAIVMDSRFVDVDMSLIEGNLMKVQNTHFENLYMKSADLKNSFWRHNTFKSVEILDTNFMMSYFDSIVVNDSKLSNALCSGSQFYKCNFSYNDLLEVNYIGCLIDENEFKTNFLRECRFATAIVRNTTFENCKLTKPIMRETQIINSKFPRSTITMPGLQRAVLIHTNLNLKKVTNANTEGMVVM